MIDLSTLSIPDLEALALEIPKEIARKKAHAKKNLLADMQALARQAGVNLEDLFGDVSASTSQPKTKRTAVAPKYRNPNDESQTWTGRGRQPLWVVAL